MTSDLHRLAVEHLWVQGGYPWSELVAPDGLIVMSEGSGSTLVDVDGRRYLDFASGFWLAGVGYGRTEIAEAMAAQAARLHYTRHQWPTEATIRAAAKLAELAPGSLSKVFFTSGGGEANEAALKLAVQYHRLMGEPERVKFIGRDLSYHGAGFATMSVGGAHILDRRPFERLLLPGTRLIPGPGHSDFSAEAVGGLEKAILAEGPGSVAAFIGEPISNSAGVHVPSDAYWPAVREICDRHGILLICDEVITAFGRTGKMFAVEHWGIVPDILTVAKGFTSGYAPAGAAIVKVELAERFRPGRAEAFQHVVTFGGHAVACAAALANLEIIERENLVERSAVMGRYLFDALKPLESHPSVIEVRGGLGLMAGLELGDRTSDGRRMSGEDRATFGKAIYDRMRKRGVNLVGSAGTISFMPPLIVERAEIDKVVGDLDEVLTEIEAEFDRSSTSGSGVR